jgi:putative endonuclease
MDRTFYVYITASRSKTLYIGVTSNIEQRISEHRQKKHKGFSATYNCNRLVWLERFTNPTSAIAREKQLKGWNRAKKLALIEQTNPSWQDLSEGWYPPTP